MVKGYERIIIEKSIVFIVNFFKDYAKIVKETCKESVSECKHFFFLRFFDVIIILKFEKDLSKTVAKILETDSLK